MAAVRRFRQNANPQPSCPRANPRLPRKRSASWSRRAPRNLHSAEGMTRSRLQQSHHQQRSRWTSSKGDPGFVASGRKQTYACFERWPVPPLVVLLGMIRIHRNAPDLGWGLSLAVQERRPPRPWRQTRRSGPVWLADRLIHSPRFATDLQSLPQMASSWHRN